MRYRFGTFEADEAARELRKRGMRVRIQEKPFVVLTALVERPGEVVTRDELRKRLWPDETFVDFDNNLNTALRRLREVLGDSAESPRFVETVPKLGYRFLAEVERLDEDPRDGDGERGRRRSRALVAAAVAVVGAVLVLGITRGRQMLEAPSPRRSLLVVLPFENLTGQESLDYFTDGLTEEVLTELSRLAPQTLGVIGKSSAMKYKGSAEDVQTIGRELGVHFVLEGGVRRSGEGENDRVRVTVRLVRVEDRSQIWAERYDLSWTDALTVQGTVMRDIAGALPPELFPRRAERDALSPKPVSHAAQDAYLKGLYQENKRTRDDVERAIQYYDEAIAIDSAHAAAHAAKARAIVSLLFRGVPAEDERAETLTAVKTHVAHALAIDPTLGEAELALANALLYFEWDFPAAGRAYERALAASPGAAQVHYWATGFFSAVGRHDDAIRSIETAAALNPAELGVLADRGLYYLVAGRYEEALADCRRIIELEGERRYALDCLLRAHVGLGDDASAAELVDRLLDVDEADASIRNAITSSSPEERVAHFRRWELQQQSQKSGVAPLQLARHHALAGDVEAAIARLEEALQEKSLGLVYVATDPRLASLHCHPRFEAVVQRILGERLAGELRCS